MCTGEMPFPRTGTEPQPRTREVTVGGAETREQSAVAVAQASTAAAAVTAER